MNTVMFIFWSLLFLYIYDSDVEACPSSFFSNFNQPINKITFLGSHNAGSISPMSGNFASRCNFENQDSFHTQLQHGARFFDIDTCVGSSWHDHRVMNCHNGGKYGVAYKDHLMSTAYTLLDYVIANPNEIVLLYFNDNTLGDTKVIAEEIERIFTGYYFKGYLARDVDKNRDTTGYPTYKQLIDTKQQIVIFLGGTLAGQIPKANWFMRGRDRIQDTYKELWFSSSCWEAVTEAKRCNNDKDFQLVNVHGSFGLCNRQLAGYCNAIIADAYSECSKTRAKPNVVLIDFLGYQPASTAIFCLMVNTFPQKNENGMGNRHSISQLPAELSHYHDTVLFNRTDNRIPLFVACNTATCTDEFSALLTEALVTLSSRVEVILINATINPYVLEKFVDLGDPTSVHVHLPAAVLLMPAQPSPLPFVNITDHTSLVKYVEDQLIVMKAAEDAELERWKQEQEKAEAWAIKLENDQTHDREL